jgi:hypothetical protein|tara:strand:- start:95 stop:376 length:282 start_codon:yes stop_codon:yes gene_type:complete
MKPRRTLTPASTQPRPDPTHRSNTWIASRLIGLIAVITAPIGVVIALSPAPPAPIRESSIERRVRDDLAASDAARTLHAAEISAGLIQTHQNQ